MQALLTAQVIFSLNIVINFLLATKVEGDEEIYVLDPQHIAINYIKGNFLIDLILTLPLGFLGDVIHPSFKLLHMIKAYRIG